jgi:BirA family biotin operon repressor/biotin-[acetyl-CoA-carboxylase] ligase
VADDRLAVVVGIGTNVVAAPEGTPTPATSLPRSASISAPRNCSPRCRTPGSNSAASGTMAAALPRSGGWAGARGRARRAGRDPDRQRSTVEGTFDTIDEAGCLIVRTADGKRVRSRRARSISARRPRWERPDGAAG